MSNQKNLHRDAESAARAGVLEVDVITVQAAPAQATKPSEGASAESGKSGSGNTTSLEKEWGVARDVIAKGDERTDALRRYGFTFVASLLTANVLFFHAVSPTAGAAAAMPWIGLGVSLVASMLVVAMRLLEKTTELLQAAAAQRATVIERHLGLELTDIITDRHDREHWRTYADVFYCFFIFSACVIGFIIGWDGKVDTLFWCRFIAFAGVAVLFSGGGVVFISQLLKLKYPRNVPNDWSLDRVECKQGDSVRVLYSWFKRTDWGFRKGDVIWRAKLQGGDKFFDYVAEADDVTDSGAPSGGRAWLWNTTGAPSGLYNIVIDPNGVVVRNGKAVGSWILDRRVRVT